MIGFLDTYGTPSIAIDAITSIGRPIPSETKHGRIYHRTVNYRHGDGVRHNDFDSSDINLMLERPTQLLAADPNLQLIYLGTDEPEPWLRRIPLIAWALCLDGRIRPVTPAGVNDDTSEPNAGWWTEMPDGSMYATCGTFDVTRHDDEAALLAWAKELCPKQEEEPSA